MDLAELAGELARHEIGWWKSHHRKDREGLVEHMARKYELQHPITYEQAREAVILMADATKEQDIAEELEDADNQSEANVHWQKAEELLVQHFELLYKNQQ